MSDPFEIEVRQRDADKGHSPAGITMTQAEWDRRYLLGVIDRLTVSDIGLPDGMTRDEAYIQGMADGESSHDCFWDGKPAKTDGKPLDIESLRMDVTDEEADAFLDAILAQDSEAPSLARLREIVATLGDKSNGNESLVIEAIRIINAHT